VPDFRYRLHIVSPSLVPNRSPLMASLADWFTTPIASKCQRRYAPKTVRLRPGIPFAFLSESAFTFAGILILPNESAIGSGRSDQWEHQIPCKTWSGVQESAILATEGSTDGRHSHRIRDIPESRVKMRRSSHSCAEPEMLGASSDRSRMR
jgi:hypothetical protein